MHGKYGHRQKAGRGSNGLGCQANFANAYIFHACGYHSPSLRTGELLEMIKMKVKMKIKEKKR